MQRLPGWGCLAKRAGTLLPEASRLSQFIELALLFFRLVPLVEAGLDSLAGFFGRHRAVDDRSAHLPQLVFEVRRAILIAARQNLI